MCTFYFKALQLLFWLIDGGEMSTKQKADHAGVLQAVVFHSDFIEAHNSS